MSCQEFSASHPQIWCEKGTQPHAGVDFFEGNLQVERAVKGKASITRIWDGTLHELEELPFAEDLHDMPDVFTPYRNKVWCSKVSSHKNSHASMR